MTAPKRPDVEGIRETLCDEDSHSACCMTQIDSPDGFSGECDCSVADVESLLAYLAHLEAENERLGRYRDWIVSHRYSGAQLDGFDGLTDGACLDSKCSGTRETGCRREYCSLEALA